MSGFFKKLFNRVIGKKEEEAPPPPAAEPEVTPTPTPPHKGEGLIGEVPADATAENEEAAPVVEAPIAPPPPSEPEPIAPELPSPSWGGIEGGGPRVEAVTEPELAPTPLPKKVPPKKPKAKKTEPKKPEPEKLEAKKPEPEPAAIVEVPATAPIEVAEPEAMVTPEPEPPPPPPPSAAEEKTQRKGWFSRLTEGLSKSSKSITGSITAIFTTRKLDKDTLQDLEDVLLQADLGLPMAERIVKAVSAGRYDKEIDPEEVKRILAAEISKVLKPVEVPFNFGAEKPFIILVVGVNGAGKTTTIGKLGAIARHEGYKVMFAACDTFRAAATEQLVVWGGRIGAKVISRPTGSDASGLAWDAMKEAGTDGTDILFIDTAGRLQNKQYLMDELDKVVRVIKKRDEAAPHAVLLVLDATTGQNAMAQADIFTKVAGVTGLIMTKLDGTARGGILVAIAEKFKIPVHAIGVGEQIDDLQPFEAEGFARAIAGLEDE